MFNMKIRIKSAAILYGVFIFLCTLHLSLANEIKIEVGRKNENFETILKDPRVQDAQDLHIVIQSRRFKDVLGWDMLPKLKNLTRLTITFSARAGFLEEPIARNLPLLTGVKEINLLEKRSFVFASVGQIAESIGKMPHLKKLRFSSKLFEGSGEFEVTDEGEEDGMLIGHNEIVGKTANKELMKSLSRLEELDSLSIEGSALELFDWDEFSKTIQKLKVLKTLSISHFKFDDNKIEKLILPSSLRGLRITECEFNQLSIVSLGQELEKLSALESLDLSDNSKVGKAGAKRLFNSLSTLKQLQSLSLNETFMEQGSSQLILKMIAQFENLHSLKISKLNLKESDVHLLNEALKGKVLNSLDLSKNSVGDEGMSRLLTTIAEQSHLKELNLGATNISEKSIAALAKVLEKSTELEDLSLGRNLIFQDEKSARSLVSAISSQKLTTLDFEFTFDRSVPISILKPALSRAVHLQYLNLAGNHLQMRSLLSLSEPIGNLSQLKILSLYRNFLAEKDEGVMTQFVEMLSKLSALSEIDVRYSDLSNGPAMQKYKIEHPHVHICVEDGGA